MALLETGWVVGRKRGGTRWVYEVAVSRDEGLRQLARQAFEAFCVQPGDGWYLVWATLGALDLEGRVPWTTAMSRPSRRGTLTDRPHPSAAAVKLSRHSD